MKQNLTRALCLLAATACIASMAVPTIVAAKTKKTKTKHISTAYLYNPKRHYQDEHVVISNPTSKCVTPTNEAAYASAVKLADKDGSENNVTTSTMTLLGDAYRKYRTGLGYAWGAMEAPYCGYGAFGVSAAQHSLGKSLSRLRRDFLSSETSLKKSGDTDMPSVVPIVNLDLPNEVSASVTSAATTTIAASTTTPVTHTEDASSTEPVEPAGPLVFQMADGKFFSPALDLEDGSIEDLMRFV